MSFYKILLNPVIFFLIAAFSFILSIQGFMGKELILESRYLRATEEERKKMDKDGLRIQTAVLFAGLGLISTLNGLAVLFNPALGYVAAFVGIVFIIYGIVSYYVLKNREQK